MAENPSVNRYFADKSMDHIDHALGRPLFPLRDSNRNHFALDTNSPETADFEASDHWKRGRSAFGLTFYTVTQEGREALAAYIASLPGQHRAFDVTFDGVTRTIPSLTASKARYAYWLKVSDALPDMTFSEFAKKCSVSAPARPSTVEE